MNIENPAAKDQAKALAAVSVVITAQQAEQLPPGTPYPLVASLAQVSGVELHLALVRGDFADEAWQELLGQFGQLKLSSFRPLDTPSSPYTELLTTLPRDSWVTFLSIRDEVPPQYFAHLIKGITCTGAVAAYSRIQRRNLKTGELLAAHPLSYQFTQLESTQRESFRLAADPERFPGAPKQLLLPLGELLERLGSDVVSDDALASFAIVHDFFTGGEHELIYQCEQFAVIENSAQTTSPYGLATFRDPRHFAEFLATTVLQRVQGDPPTGDRAWVGLLALYYLTWYFVPDENLSTQMNAEMHHRADQFHAAVTQLLAAIAPQALDALPPSLLPTPRYLALKHGYRGEVWHETPVRFSDVDQHKNLIQLSYFYTGPAPEEQIQRSGQTIQPIHAKHREIAYAGKTLLYERIMWLPAGTATELHLNGEKVSVAAGGMRRVSPWVSRVSVARFRPAKGSGTSTAQKIKAGIAKLLSPGWWWEKTQRKIAFSAKNRAKYANAWVLIDRVDRANDNAEHLMRHLLKHEPRQGAYFALTKDSSDWKRLKAEFGDYLVAYGSLRWRFICLNAELVISSQAGPYVYNPVQLRGLGGPKWKFIFLQHGVIGTDLSRWLNLRKFTMFVTTTPDEYGSLAGDGSRYKMTTKEVVMTGLPRHDRLIQLDRQLAPKGRRRILIAPTWREYLLGEKNPKDGTRKLLDDFNSTVFATAWRELLTSPQLHALAQEHEATIAFMPHPNLEPYLPGLDLGSNVEILPYSRHNIQDVIVSAKLVITDLSSLVFDAAMLRRPIVYYQFDRESIFGGEHTVRQGYFSYEEKGFGPLALTQEDVITAVSHIAANNFNAVSPYAERIETTFYHRDDQNCARVIQAIRDQLTPGDPQQDPAPTPTPLAPPNAPIPEF